MEGGRLEAQYVRDDGLDSNGFSENKKELTYEQAEIIYNDGKRLRDHIYDTSGQDALFCTQIFNEVYTKVFSDINAAERAKHVMHRVLTGTSVNSSENVTYIVDERDRYIYEKFLMQMSRAKSNAELHAMIDDLYREHTIDHGVQ